MTFETAPKAHHMESLNEQAFLTFPELETPRLLLREIRPTDAPQILAMRASQRVNRFIPRAPMADLAEAEALVARTRQAYADRQAIGWAAVRKGTDTIMGTCGLTGIEHRNLRAEIGGELQTDHWGKHMAIEAVTAICQYGLHTLGLHTIEAKVHPDNRGAIALLSALGFVKEAHFRERGVHNGRFIDMAVYTLFSA